MTVFDTFKQVAYELLTVTRGTVYGNRITDTRELQGVFKLRASSGDANNIEYRIGSATIHAHPEDYSEPYADIVGQGVRVAGATYEITDVTAGTNFDTGIVEHLTLTLQRAEYADETL